MGAPAASPDVSVVVPTFRRLEPLRTAAGSVSAQTGLGGLSVELVVVDNNPEPIARATVEALATGAAFPVRYVHEPRAGVAHARNAGLAATSAPLVAWLDDDQVASPGWLAALLATQRRFDADLTFGPLQGRLPEGTPQRAYLERFFSREGPSESRLLDHPYGAGACLIRRAALPGAQPFDPGRNRIGGEDDLLFGDMAAAGARLAWAADAQAWEAATADRGTIRYALRRAFAYGQGPCYAAATATPKRLHEIPYWMGVGAGQAAVYGLTAAAQRLLRRPRWIDTLDRAARGLGKVLWFPPFKIAFYGAAT